MDRREFLTLLGGVFADTAAKKAEAAKKRELTPEQQVIEKSVEKFGVTGEKLPMTLKAAIKNMPKGYELDLWQVVYVSEFEKFLDDRGIINKQIRKLEAMGGAQVVEGKFPIYINGSLESMQKLIRDPHGIEILKGLLLHERLHVASPELPHSEVYQQQLDYLKSRTKSVRIPSVYDEYFAKLEEKIKFYQEQERRARGPGFVHTAEVRPPTND